MALKSVQIGIKFQMTRRMIQEHINVIMYEISLPLMLLTQSEYQLWTENPIEYVRLQVDQSNPFNCKSIVKLLVNSVCGIKTTKKQRVSQYLSDYLQVLAQNLEQPSQDFRVKEAIMHSLGNLKDKI
jgi:hypothetical protein